MAVSRRPAQVQALTEVARQRRLQSQARPALAASNPAAARMPCWDQYVAAQLELELPMAKSEWPWAKALTAVPRQRRS